jgi:peptidoglycan/xylan/chitin deacetylase (PgdA/CDA1 family)
LIASGRVRRARRRALSGNVITAIYFHKPSLRLFLRCVRWLVKHGYTFISAKELWVTLHEGRPLPKGAVWLSFDDGWKELLSNVLPVIHQHKIPITLFVPPGIVAGDGRFNWVPARNGFRDSLTVGELKQVAAAHGEITFGSHTFSHVCVPHCAEETVQIELALSRSTLESWTGTAVECFSYPYGEADGRATPCLIDSGYKVAATTENAFVTLQSDPYLLPRFAVADDVSFSEAICNMVGVWRPVCDRLKTWLRKT